MAYIQCDHPAYKQSGLMVIHQQNKVQTQLICCDKNTYDTDYTIGDGKMQKGEFYEFSNLQAGYYEFQFDDKKIYCFILHQTLADGDRLRFRNDLNHIWAVSNLRVIDITPYRVLTLSPSNITIPKAINGSLDCLSLVGFDYVSSLQDANRSWISPISHEPITNIQYVSKQGDSIICDKTISLKDEILAIQTLRDRLYIDKANQLALFKKHLGFLYLTGDEPFEVYESSDPSVNIFIFRFSEVALNGKIRCSHLPSISMHTILRKDILTQGIAVAHDYPDIGFKIPKKHVKDLDDFRRQLREKYNDPNQEPVTIIYEYAKSRTYHKLLDDYEMPIAMGDNQIQVYHPNHPDIDIGKSYFYKSIYGIL